MMPSGIAMGILNPVAGKMYDRIGGRPLALLGFAIMTVLLQCLFDRFGSVFPQCGLMVFPGVVIVSR